MIFILIFIIYIVIGTMYIRYRMNTKYEYRYHRDSWTPAEVLEIIFWPVFIICRFAVYIIDNIFPPEY